VRPIIEIPRGKISVNKRGKAVLKWNTRFQPKWQRQYSRAQKFVDSEVLRRSEPYTPLLTGTLIKSGQLGTYIGSGEVEWIVPYASDQYYLARKVGSRTGALRGSYWFERMKKEHKSSIVAGARAFAGGG